MFDLKSNFSPTGDQVEAIKELVKGKKRAAELAQNLHDESRTDASERLAGILVEIGTEQD